MNLPAEKHSHGLRHLAAIEGARGSFDGTVAAIERCAGQGLGKRQVEALAARTAVDFGDYYAGRLPSVIGASDLLGTELRSNINSEMLNGAGFRKEWSEVERARMYGCYILAVLNAPSFQTRYLEEIQQDFPRVPQPGSTSLLEALADRSWPHGRPHDVAPTPG